MAENMKNFDYFFDLAKKENCLESHDNDEAAKEESTWIKCYFLCKSVFAKIVRC